MTSKKTDSWLADVDIARSAENTLSGVVLFFAGLFRTTLAVFRASPELHEKVVARPEYKTYDKVDFVRPLSFAVLWWAVVLIFAYGDTGTILFLRPLLQQNSWLTSGLPDTLRDLTLAKAASALIPLVLLIALIALTTNRAFAWAGAPDLFKVHLNIAAYAAGGYAAIQVLAVVAEMHLWIGDKDEPSFVRYLRSASFIIGWVVCFGLLVLLIRSWLLWQRKTFGLTWGKTVAAAIMGLLLASAILVSVLFIAQPVILGLAPNNAPTPTPTPAQPD
jgi:hypothetical protein